MKEIVSQNNKGGDATSGGGFSALYDVPEWQRAVVDGYFAKVEGTAVAPKAGFRRGGRGYPDLTIAGTRFIVALGGGLAGIGGTSVSTPTMAGVISLVNAARFTAGGNALGWLNPALYQHHEAFVKDVTDGRNNCTCLETCCSEGFEATAGWDPASGLGSLDFVKFRDTMLSIAGLPATK